MNYPGSNVNCGSVNFLTQAKLPPPFVVLPSILGGSFQALKRGLSPFLFLSGLIVYPYKLLFFKLLAKVKGFLCPLLGDTAI